MNMGQIRRVLAGAVVASFAVAGCGSDSGGSKAVEAEKYADTVCDAVTDLRDAIGERSDDLSKARDDEASLRTRKKVLTDYFTASVKDTDDFLEELDAAGTPDIDQGEQAAKSIEDAFRLARDGFADAAETASDLPTDDDDAFEKAVDDLNKDFQDSFGAAVGDLKDNPDLVTLFEDTDCDLETDTAVYSQTAEKTISDQGVDDVKCEEPDSTEVGTTFECTGTSEGGDQLFEVEIDEGGQLFITLK